MRVLDLVPALMGMRPTLIGFEVRMLRRGQRGKRKRLARIDATSLSLTS